MSIYMLATYLCPDNIDKQLASKLVWLNKIK